MWRDKLQCSVICTYRSEVPEIAIQLTTVHNCINYIILMYNTAKCTLMHG